MLRFLSSKSELLMRAYEQIALFKSGKLTEKPIFIVPEQHHFETERMLYKELHRENIAYIEITTFTKLSEKILKKLSPQKPYADDIMKKVILLRTVISLKNELIFYKKELSGRDILSLVQRFENLIAGFQNEGITPEDLHKALDDEVGIDFALREKISDITKIYSLYSENVNTDYADRLDNIRLSAALAEEHEYFSRKHIYFTDFDMFTGSQYKLIYAMLKHSSEVCINLYVDSLPSRSVDFKYINGMYNNLQKYCKLNSVSVENSIISDNTPNKWNDLMLVVAPDIYKEYEFIGAKIRELLIKGEYTQNEIAIFTRKSESIPLLISTLKRYEINAFADMPSPIIEKPLIHFVITLLEALDLDTEKLLLYIKSGFLRVSAEGEKISAIIRRKHLKLKRTQGENAYTFLDTKKRSVRLGRRNINALERAAKKYNFRGSDWKKSFPEDSEFAYLEPIRGEIIGKLTELKNKLKNSTGDHMTETLTEFLLDDLELSRTVLSIVNRRNTEFREGFSLDRTLSDDYRKLWEILTGVFESVHEALKGFSISIRDYTLLLRSVFGATNIAKPPEVIDAVTIGDMERTRAEGIRVLFIAGANQNVFPKRTTIESEFTPEEVEELIFSGINFADNREMRYLKEQFTVRKTINTPSEKLIITASLRNESWTETLLSPIFKKLSLKHGVKIEKTNDFPESFFLSSRKSVKLGLVKNFKNTAKREALMKAIGEAVSEPTRDFNHTVSGSDINSLLRLDTMSPSAVEKLNTCRFLYFCSYGLNIKGEDTRDDEPSPIERGNYVHFCLEKLLDKYKDNLEGFSKGVYDDYRDEMNSITTDFIKDIPYITKAHMSMLRGYERSVFRLATSFAEELSFTKMKPYEFERKFSFNLGNLTIKGRIDRVDILESGGKEYVRVVDYKTGMDEFDYDALFHGRNLQTLLYLFAVENDGKIPSGAYIMPSRTDSVSAAQMPSGVADSGYKHWLETHKPSGIQISNGADVEVLEEYKKYLKSKTGSRAAFIKETMLEKSEYTELKKTVDKYLSEKIKDVKSGNVSAVPTLKSDRKDPCEYCEYKDFCKNDGKMRILCDEK